MQLEHQIGVGIAHLVEVDAGPELDPDRLGTAGDFLGEGASRFVGGELDLADGEPAAGATGGVAATVALDQFTDEGLRLKRRPSSSM